MEFKDILKKLRQDKNVSQQKLADDIYVSRSAVAKWENGLGFPSEANIEELCKYFNVTKDELLPPICQEEIVEKNVLSKKKTFRTKVRLWAGTILDIMFLVFIIVLFIPNKGISRMSLKADYKHVIDCYGYTIAVGEKEYIYYQTPETECVEYTFFKDQYDVIWETDSCSSIAVYKHKLLNLYMNDTYAKDKVKLYRFQDSSNKYAGYLGVVKIKNTYYYFYLRERYIARRESMDEEYKSDFSNILKEKTIPLSINGEEIDMKYGYYFKSKTNYTDENYSFMLGNENCSLTYSHSF